MNDKLLEDAQFTKSILYENIICPSCKGCGCGSCNNIGILLKKTIRFTTICFEKKLPLEIRSLYVNCSFKEKYELCPVCKGNSIINVNDKCTECNGNGRIKVFQTNIFEPLKVIA